MTSSQRRSDNQTAAGPTPDRLAEVIMAVLEKPELAGYRLPKRPADLAYFVVDALYPEAVAAFARATRAKVEALHSYYHPSGVNRAAVLRLLDVGVPQDGAWLGPEYAAHMPQDGAPE